MISPEEIAEIARIKGIKNKGYAEKDYILDIVLLLISRNTKDELVFKGGTCLYKFYKIARFSEDIDFTQKKEINIDSLLKTIISGLSAFGIEAEIKEKRMPYNSVLIAMKAKGPLFRNTPQSFCNIGIDINLKSSIEIEPANASYNSLYRDIPSFSLLIMDEKEIFAEKVRAIITRNKGRDVYDLWFLLEKDIKPDSALIEKKLAYYNMKFSISKLEKALDAKKEVWEKDLSPLVFGALPTFNEAKKKILSAFKG